MSFFLYNFFHNETNDRSEKGTVVIPKDKNSWPLSWKVVAYKNYGLFKSFPLSIVGGQLWEILCNRRSAQRYIVGNAINEEKISYILKCGYGLQNHTEEGREEHRTVPSGGKRYPLEVYIFLFQSVDSYSPGAYHYGVKSHVLEPAVLTTFSQKDIESFSSQEITKSATGMICLTSVFRRTVEKYGSRGYRYILLEAGHVAQNMLLAGTEKGVNISPIGGGNEDVIEKFLGLGSQQERVVYTLFF